MIGMADSAHVDTFCRDHLPPRELVAGARLSSAAGARATRRASTAPPSCSTAGRRRRRRPHRLPRPGRPLDLRRAARDREPHRPRARGRSRAGARQPRAAARPQQADDGRLLVRGAQGGRRRGLHHAAAARAGADLRSPTKAQIRLALCRRAARRRLRAGHGDTGDGFPREGARVVQFHSAAPDSLEALMQGKPATFDNVRHGRGRYRPHRLHLGHHRQGQRARCTSTATCWPSATASRSTCCRPEPDDIFFGSPAARLHLRARRPAPVPDAHRRLRAAPGAGRAAAAARGASRSTAPRSASPRPPPTARWRRMVKGSTSRASGSASRPARRCPRRRFELWKQATGIEIIDGIGSTEMLHIFISAAGDDIRPGATGKAVPGYQAPHRRRRRQRRPARHGRPPRGEGPDRLPLPRRPRAAADYVQNGWNLTGDSYLRGRRRLLLVPGAHRRHDHLRRLQHRRPRGRETCCSSIPRSPNAAWSACPTRSAARS